MNQSDQLSAIYEKLKTSPHWRDDFRIVESENIGGIPVYRIEADDQEQPTIMAIVKLNELFQL